MGIILRLVESMLIYFLFCQNTLHTDGLYWLDTIKSLYRTPIAENQILSRFIINKTHTEMVINKNSESLKALEFGSNIVDNILSIDDLSCQNDEFHGRRGLGA